MHILLTVQECNELRFTVAALGEQLSAADEVAETSARAASAAEQRAFEAEQQHKALAAERNRLGETVSQLRAELAAAVASRDLSQEQLRTIGRTVASEAAVEVDRRKRASGGSEAQTTLGQHEEELDGLRCEAAALRSQNAALSEREPAASSALQESRATIGALQEEAEELRRHCAAADAEKAALHENLVRMQSELSAAVAQAQAAAVAAADERLKPQPSDGLRADVARERQSYEARLTEAGAALEASRETERGLRAELAALRSDMSALERQCEEELDGLRREAAALRSRNEVLHKDLELKDGLVQV